MNAGRTEVLGEHVTNPPTPSVGGTTIATGWCEACLKPVSVTLLGKQCPRCRRTPVRREWPVSAVEARITAQFEKEVRRRGRAVYIDIRAEDPVESESLRSQYNTEFQAGAYNWDDVGMNTHNYVREARKRTWGAFYLMYLLMLRCDPTMTEALTQEIWLANPEDSMATYLWTLGLTPGNASTPVIQEPAGAVTDPRTVSALNQSPQTTPTTKMPALQPTFA